MKPFQFQASFSLLLTFLSACQTSTLDRNENLVLYGDKIYLSPDQPPINNGMVVVNGKRIVGIGPKGSVPLPPNAKVSRCSGPVITAGFQNSHVHFVDSMWQNADQQPVEKLQIQLRNMLTRYGYTTVVDIASDPDHTFALQHRIDRGEVVGPRILTFGMPIYPPNGIPSYLDHLPPDLLRRFPQPSDPAAAVKVVEDNLKRGAAGTKLFIVTPQHGGALRRMPADVALAAAKATHEAGKLVFAHPTDIAGVEASLAAGVDVLAHTTHGIATPWPEALRRKAVEQGLSMTPTLQLMGYELKKEKVPPPLAAKFIAMSVEHVRAFAAAGGDIIFGTDVGYMTDFNPEEEYRLMAQAGLTPMQILASLTTRPAAKWKDTGRGQLAVDKEADIVVLDADPAVDATHFSQVRCAIGSGKVIYDAKQ